MAPYEPLFIHLLHTDGRSSFLPWLVGNMVYGYGFAGERGSVSYDSHSFRVSRWSPRIQYKSLRVCSGPQQIRILSP
jgi:hypothetical protein